MKSHLRWAALDYHEAGRRGSVGWLHNAAWVGIYSVSCTQPIAASLYRLWRCAFSLRRLHFLDPPWRTIQRLHLYLFFAQWCSYHQIYAVMGLHQSSSSVFLVNGPTSPNIVRPSKSSSGWYPFSLPCETC